MSTILIRLEDNQDENSEAPFFSTITKENIVHKGKTTARKFVGLGEKETARGECFIKHCVC